MILLVRPKWLRKNFNGMAIWPFVILRYRHLVKDINFLNHERIHLRQQVELFVVFFYLWYAIEFLVRWIGLGNRDKAYQNISFEREAYFYEADMDYLKRRRFWYFLRFL
ncbi:MAG: hypothetical protein WBA61_02115 [Aequorivita sp.]